MSDDDRDFPASLRDSVRETYGEPASHPGDESWIRYCEGELEPHEVESLQDHLVTCRRCAALVQSVESFVADSSASGEAPRSAESAVVWDSLRTKLGPPAPPLEGHPSAWQRTWHKAPSVYAVALAASLLFVAGVSTWGVLEHRRYARLIRPQPNPPTPALYAESERGSSPVLVFEPGTPSMVVRLTIPGGVVPPYPSYRMALVSSTGRTVFAGAIDPEDGAHTTFPFVLWRDFLDEANYTIRLVGLGEDGEELLEEFPIAVVDGR